MGFTCNQNTFSSVDHIDTGIVITIIVLNFLLLLFFLVKMCRLCSYAFSYSNYHIHETYKLYTLAMINIMAALIVRKTQMDLYYFIYPNGKDDDTIPQPQPYDSNRLGYYIINEVFGIISIFTNNILLLFNAFNWLAIAKNCDFTLNDDSNIVQGEQLDNLAQEGSFVRVSQKKERKHIYYAKVYSLYLCLPALLVLGLFGTLNHYPGDNWCIVINLSILVSSFIPLVVFCIAFALYMKKFSDPEVSLKTKLGLIFLLVAIIVRGIYYLTFVIKSDDSESWDAAWNMVYVILCSMAPMLVMTILSELQLHKEQFNILRRSSGLIFKSTII